MYADDTTVLSAGAGVDQAVSNAEIDIGNVSDYFNRNDLFLNVGKSVCVNFTMRSASGADNISGSAIALGAQGFDMVDHTRFLGVVIDRHLKWDAHVDGLCARVAKLCFTVRRLREYLDFSVLRMYYFAHIHSIISYGILAWGSSSDVSRVLILQKRAIRYMLNMPRLDSCRPAFKRLKIMTVISVYIYQLCLCVRLDGGNSGR